MKRKAKKKVPTMDLSKPFNPLLIGSDDDPCFGHFEQKDPACKRCGASELCVIKQTQLLKSKATKELGNSFMSNDPRDDASPDKVERFIDDYFKTYGTTKVGKKHNYMAILKEAHLSGIFNGYTKKELSVAIKKAMYKIKNYKMVVNKGSGKAIKYIKRIK